MKDSYYVIYDTLEHLYLKVETDTHNSLSYNWYKGVNHATPFETKELAYLYIYDTQLNEGNNYIVIQGIV